MRAFGRMRGVSYSFDAVDAQALYARAQDYVIHLTQLETSMCHSNALTRTREIGAPFFSLLEEDLPEKADCIDYLLRGCELCAQIAEVNPAQVMTFATLRDELHARLPLEKAESMLGSLLGGGSACSLPSRRLTASWSSPACIICCFGKARSRRWRFGR